MAKFDISFARYMAEEGWVSENSRHDIGGWTICGISSVFNPNAEVFAVANRMLKESGKVDVKCKEIVDAVISFYRVEYARLMLDSVTSQKIADQVFQAVENIGSMPIRWAQKIAALLTGTPLDADGVMGAKSVAGINSIQSERFFTVPFYMAQDSWYDCRAMSVPSQKANLAGWKARALRFV